MKLRYPLIAVLGAAIGFTPAWDYGMHALLRTIIALGG
jgi:hypothetical protein